MTTIFTDTALNVVSCATCGIAFAIPESFDRKLRETGQSFHCPNGHDLHFASELEKLKTKLAAQEAETRRQRENYFEEQRRHEATQKKLQASKRQVARVEKRVAAGVCPCCQRTFSQLARHMQSKHVDYVKHHGIPIVENEQGEK